MTDRATDRAENPTGGQHETMSTIQAGQSPRRVSILGATGSVGESTLDLIRHHPSDFDVVSLTAGNNAGALIELAKEFRPGFVAINDPSAHEEVAGALRPLGIETGAGPAAIEAAALYPTDWLMAAIVGAAGLAPTLAAARAGVTIAFANKECLVCAGSLFLKEAGAAGARLLPVDSEHNAIFQVLEAQNRDALERIILTASGGPFRTTSLAQMTDATPKMALAHPNWSMGAKISIDSATMMNKGLELIEAAYLFDVSSEQIEVLVHPESVIHSMVAYQDGSVLAQLGTPDMRTPIAHALAWPRRMPAPVKRLDFPALAQLTFEAPDLSRFPALELARDSLQTGRGAPTVLSAANEIAVGAFLRGQIGFTEIASIVRKTIEVLDRSGVLGEPSSLDDIYELDNAARNQAHRLVEAR